MPYLNYLIDTDENAKYCPTHQSYFKKDMRDLYNLLKSFDVNTNQMRDFIKKSEKFNKFKSK